MTVDVSGFAAAVMSIVPGILLTETIAHLRRGGVVAARSATVMVVAIAAVSDAGAVAQLLLRTSPVWLSEVRGD